MHILITDLYKSINFLDISFKNLCIINSPPVTLHFHVLIPLPLSISKKFRTFPRQENQKVRNKRIRNLVHGGPPLKIIKC